jgi:selenocysteine lyase/cysteine desulfurase
VLSERTRWIAVTAASNAVGTVPDLPGIVEAAHARGARVYVDAVHAAPHRRLDVSALGCDALACSAYKWFGPHVGILCASPDLLAEIKPDRLRPAPADPPDSWEQGTAAFESLAGVRAAADYVRGLGFDAIGAHERALLERALEGLGAIDGVTLYGTAAERAPTIMFRVGTVHPTEAAAALAERGVAVWHGNYYAHELERFLDLVPDGALRAGFVHYNDEEDVDRLVDGVRALAERGA